MDGVHKKFICDVAKDIDCDADDILRIAANDNQLKRPPFFLWACLTGGWAHHLNIEGEPMPNRVQMTVGDNWSLLMPAQVSQLRRKGAITLTKFIQSTDEIAPDDWSWWRLEPPQEIAAKDVAIEVADIEALQSLLVEAAPAPNVEAATDTTTPGAKGITKGAVINAFEGLHFNRDKWSKYLGDPPNWLKECRISRGSKKASALWNPVLIAAALFDKNVPIRKLDAVFAGLKDWTDKWQETAASLRD